MKECSLPDQDPEFLSFPMSTIAARSLIASLIQHLGLTDVTQEPDGSCGLAFDRETNVTLEPDVEDPGLLHLHTAVGTVPAEGRRSLLILLLRGNYLGRATGGASLALNADGTEVLLQTIAHVHSTSLKQLSDQLAMFVQTAGLWRQRLDGSFVSRPAEVPLPDLDLSSMVRV